ncbi:ABC transporter substrate-binding protein [Shewanella cyperi]|uniref:ABC transporter substrate-binding protein n=1 Tax=Shewanella cyperi TaxID=2814292 RepID=A0A975AKY3_9GAMM|nr:ABC transporter substrate-binding protein [Shewanella cyperi]QSX30211.1 ABC transporter substrate-binding protein [Shewanella cyperi]
MNAMFKCGLALAALLSFWLRAEPVEIRVVSGKWIGFSNEDGTGYYFELLRRAFPEPEWQLSYSIVPFARSLYLFDHQKADIVLGVYKGDIDNGQYCRLPVELDTVDIAMTPNLAASWSGPRSLEHKKVQAYLAYGYDRLVSVPMYYEESSNLLDMLNRVNNGYIDAVLDYRPSMEALVSKLERPQRFVILDSVISAEVYFGFADTDFGNSLRIRFDEVHHKLIDSGEQQALLRQVEGQRNSEKPRQ